LGEGKQLASNFSLDGSMIPRTACRSVNHRCEERVDAGSLTGVLTFRGRRHVVRLVNTSPSGAMLVFPEVPNIGEQVALHILDHGQLSAQVRWVRDGRVGVSFDQPIG
jgi:hypothetical protein